MPLVGDPSEVYRFVLWTDKKKTEKQPAFLFRFPSKREASKVSRLFDESEVTGEAGIDKILEGAKVLLVGWENMRLPYSIDEADEVLSIPDLIEVRARLLSELTITECDKKKLASTSDASLESGAKAAQPETKETVQPPTNLPS